MKKISIPIPPILPDQKAHIEGIMEGESAGRAQLTHEPLIRVPKQPRFDADLGPTHPSNREAARVRNLHWNNKTKCYEDEDGCPTRDRFGQPL